MHLRCCAHIINLVVRDGLEEQNAFICKFQNAVNYLRSLSGRQESFEKDVEFENFDCKQKPCLDVEIRWNFTFLMLETAVMFEKVFDRLELTDRDYASYFCNETEDGEEGTRMIPKTKKKKKNIVGVPNEDDWSNARFFLEYLRIFYDVTKKISGSKYVTSNMFVKDLVTMHAAISKMCRHTDENKRKIALSMNDKYDKYWDNLDNINVLLCVALVLDPRNKLKYLEFCLDQIYPKSQTSTGTSNQDDCSMKIDLDDGFSKYLETQYGEGDDFTEVDIYLQDKAEKRGDNSFDVLGWWNKNMAKFLILSQVAKHVLAMPISTVASESAFSTGGRVIDKYRSSFMPKSAKALICAQDWLRSTPADLQDMPINGLPLEEMVENSKKLELEAVSTTCYTQNRSLIRLHYDNTPYELMHKKKPDLSFLHVFGSLCYPTNDNEDFGKLKPKADIVLVAAAPRHVDPTGSSMSTLIDQDALSTSNPSKQEQEQSLIISQGLEESLELHTFMTIHCMKLFMKTQLFKDRNMIGDPSRSVSIRKQLKTDAMWCYFDDFLTLVELKTFKEAMLESSLIKAMQEIIHEFERLQV
nr:zinc finger BED domain-containing protein RICESLEEPER 2-like [Tanacetum cinerariifolium]